MKKFGWELGWIESAEEWVRLVNEATEGKEVGCKEKQAGLPQLQPDLQWCE